MKMEAEPRRPGISRKQKGYGPANSLDLNFRFPELRENKLLLFETTTLVEMCHGSAWR